MAEAERIKQAAEAKERELKELLDADELTMLEKLAERRGRSVDDVLRRAISRITNDGQLTPEQREADILRRVEAAEKRHNELMARIEAEESKRAAAAAEAEFVSFLNDYRGAAISALDEKTFPVLSAFDADEVADSVITVANTVADRTGEIPDVAQVLAYLERQEQAKIDRVAGRVGYSKQPQPSTQPQQPAPKRDVSGRFLPAAVPNQVAAERGAAPPDFSRMSERERLAEAGKFLAEKGIGTGR